MNTDTRPRTPAWLVMWECHCSDVQVDRADLPARCPGHDRAQLEKPQLLDVLPQYVGVHECDVTPCAVTS